MISQYKSDVLITAHQVWNFYFKNKKEKKKKPIIGIWQSWFLIRYVSF